MAIRPFYMEATIDGRASKLTGGPKGKGGWQDVVVYQRNKGSITTAFRIESSSAMHNGKLILITRVLDKNGTVVAREETEY